MKILLNKNMLNNAIKYLQHTNLNEYNKINWDSVKVSGEYDTQGSLSLEIKRNNFIIANLHLSINSGLDANALNAYLISEYDRVTEY